jgi:hypothetical protein
MQVGVAEDKILQGPLQVVPAVVVQVGMLR